jgi:hypothetical protein
MQNYLDVNKNKGAVPSDTLGKTSSTDSRMGYYSAENPKNNKALNKAVKTRDAEASKALDEKFTRRKNETNAAYTKRTSMKNGGTVKKPLVKAQKGTTVKTKAIPNDVYKRDSTNYANAADKYLNSTSKKDFQVGADSLKAIKSRYGTPNALEKRMGRTVGGYGVDSDIKKKGGMVKSKKK